VYEYTYHEMKIIVDGEFVISDETGQKVTGRKGDVFYFPKGSKITFETESFGVGFFVGQRMVSFVFFFPSWILVVRFS
jgi:ethanolamine utilization protein EutQ (cupin superfamily)